MSLPVPYYQDEACTIYHGDCRDVLPELLGELTVDVVIADPPYGDTSLVWDVPVHGWLPEIPALLNPWGSLWLFGSMRALMTQAEHLRTWRFAQDVVWEKHNGSGFHADRFKRVHEHVLQFYPPGVAWATVHKSPVYTMDATRRTVRRKQRPPHMGETREGVYRSEDGGPRLMRSVLKVHSCHGEAMHPTQKPLGIIAPLLDYSCPPYNAVVLDPFMGSGSTLVAAKLSGRKAVGIELHEPYAEIAAKRLAQEVLPLEVSP